MNKKQKDIEREAAWAVTCEIGEMPATHIDNALNPDYKDWWNKFYLYVNGAFRKYKGHVPESFKFPV
jgi:hypothetical protein